MGMSEVVMLVMSDACWFWMWSQERRWLQDFGVYRWTKPIICNTLFMKQESKLVTYVAGPVKSTVDYITVS